jgi:putative oxidoreductase
MIAVPTRVRDLYDQASAIRENQLARDAALLGTRIALAWIFIYNGGGKLFGLFGGGGIHQASIFFGTVAHLHPAELFTVMAGITEFFGGIAVGVGLFGRIAAIGLVGDMVVAMATVTWGNGIATTTASGGNYQINVALAALALVIALLGTGKLSLDEGIRTLVARHSASKSGSVSTAPAPQAH